MLQCCMYMKRISEQTWMPQTTNLLNTKWRLWKEEEQRNADCRECIKH